MNENNITPERGILTLGLTYILLLPPSSLPAYILLSETQLISLIATMPHQMREESENLWKHHDDDGIFNDDTKENGLEDDAGFYWFHKNEYVTSEDDLRAMMILMG